MKMRTGLGVSALSLATCAGLAHAQTFQEGFEGGVIPATWTVHNQSNPIGTTTWGAQQSAVFAPHGGVWQASANYNNTGATGTISNWLITPSAATITNGDTFSFWTRTVTGAPYADRLQARMSTAGASVNTGATENDVGDFTTLLLDINPGLIAGGAPPGYPDVYTLESITIAGLGGPTAGSFALRYFVTGAGLNGANSNYIGVDDVSYIQSTATGACCKNDGTCSGPITGAACLAQGGLFVANTACANANCAPGGACCKPDGTCQFLTQAACTPINGIWTAGQCGTCPKGACCKNDGTCADTLTVQACEILGGVYKGNSTICANVGSSCVQPGSTCLTTSFTGGYVLGATGDALYFDAAVTTGILVKGLDVDINSGAGIAFGISVYTAPGGNWAAHWGLAGDWTLVGTGTGVSAGGNLPSHVTLNAAIPLPVATYAVAIVTDARANQIFAVGTTAYSDANVALTLGGVNNPAFSGAGYAGYSWDGSLCYDLLDTNLTGACCKPDGSCSGPLTQAACTTLLGTWSVNQTCAQVTCPQPGACCKFDGTCTENSFPSTCASQGGTYAGAHVTCAQAQCPAPCPVVHDTLPAGPVTGWTSTYGTQTQRLNRSGVASTCAVPGPHTNFAAGTFPYAKYDYPNTSASGHCVTFQGTFAAGGMYAAAYVGAFNPADPTVNCVGELGASPVGTGAFSFTVPALTAFSVVVHEVTAGAGASGYTFQLNGGGALSCNAPSGCYANCDLSTNPPVLNVQDFTCFLAKFVAGNAYANCDASTNPPVLNVQDFSCFLAKYVTGCP